MKVEKAEKELRSLYNDHLRRHLGPGDQRTIRNILQAMQDDLRNWEAVREIMVHHVKPFGPTDAAFAISRDDLTEVLAQVGEKPPRRRAR